MVAGGLDPAEAEGGLEDGEEEEEEDTATALVKTPHRAYGSGIHTHTIKSFVIQ